MKIIEAKESKSVSKLSRFIIRKLFTCRQKERKKQETYVSYAEIYMTAKTGSRENKCEEDDCNVEIFPEGKIKLRNPESASLVSQTGVAYLLPALRQFEKSVIDCR